MVGNIVLGMEVVAVLIKVNGFLELFGEFWMISYNLFLVNTVYCKSLGTTNHKNRDMAANCDVHECLLTQVHFKMFAQTLKLMLLTLWQHLKRTLSFLCTNIFCSTVTAILLLFFYEYFESLFSHFKLFFFLFLLFISLYSMLWYSILFYSILWFLVIINILAEFHYFIHDWNLKC